MNEDVFKLASSKLNFKYYGEVNFTGQELNVYYGNIEVTNEDPNTDNWFRVGFTYSPGNLQFMMATTEVYAQYNKFINKHNK